MITPRHIAEICHEANRYYCKSIGDDSQPSWEEAPEWQKESALAGVVSILNGVVTSPEQSHVSWLMMKLDDGWGWGPVKDLENKKHPCMVSYGRLPEEQKAKDTLFFSIVRGLEPMVR